MSPSMPSIGPSTLHAQQLHSVKYRSPGETFDDFSVRYASATADGEKHFRFILDAIRQQRVLPAGRQQRAVGQPYQTTASNCFVGGTIPDSIEGIFHALQQSAMTLRTGGGCGWDFSSLRPLGDRVSGLGSGSFATGPVSFMNCWNSMCETIMSAGHRRGAMMGVLRVDHPDIMTFINAKQDEHTLKRFNISVGITDAFMEALASGGDYKLIYGERSYGKLSATEVWELIMRRNWDYGDPGVLFIDRINEFNNLYYCEDIAATNPCGEQPLPPHGACLLWSLNIPKYLVPKYNKPVLVFDPSNLSDEERERLIADVRPGGIIKMPKTPELIQSSEPSFELDFDLFRHDIEIMVRAVDNVIDRSRYPIPEQQAEQEAKRRMGAGVTGMANALEVMEFSYGSTGYLELQDEILTELRDTAYLASSALAKEKGSFPLYDKEKYLEGQFIKTLPDNVRDSIRSNGIRNSHLLSIAPTGTISMCADNISSGIEPPWALELERDIEMPSGKQSVTLRDWAFEIHGIKGKTASEVTPLEHVAVSTNAQRFIDSAVSKTINIEGQIAGEGPGTTFPDFKDVYLKSYELGAKGCTTFNSRGKKAGILRVAVSEAAEGEACTIDLETGARTCEE